jgi:hypothetical protein
MHPERGRLLFRTRSLHRRGNSLLGVFALAAAAPSVVQAYRHGWARDKLALAFFYGASYGAVALLGLRQVAFYENGIFLPQEASGPRPRFVPWISIERYHWEDDILTVVPSSSILSTGGGEPLTGGSVKVPQDRRVEVENLLARSGIKASTPV